MNEINKVQKQFLITLWVFIIFVVAVVAIIILSFIFIDQNIAYIIFFAFMLVLMFTTSIFRSKIDTIINISYLMKITEDQGPPLDINRLYNEDSLHSYLINDDFVNFAHESKYLLYYKVTKDHIKKMLRGYILEIVVYIKDSESEFYLDAVDDKIRKIQDILINDKQRLEKMLITQIKIVDELDTNTKEQLTEIVFVRSQSGIISTINVGLHLESNKAVFLYAENYSPSLAYTYHIEQIKKMI